MAAFDSAEAAAAYAVKDTLDLVHIAHIDPSYIPEAKALAARELEKRGVVTDKAIIAEARREMSFRADVLSHAASDGLERQHNLLQRLREIVAVGGLWTLALVVPWQAAWKMRSFGWLELLLVGFWLYFVVHACRRYDKGGRRTLVFILLIPALLGGVGLILRLSV